MNRYAFWVATLLAGLTQASLLQAQHAGVTKPSLVLQQTVEGLPKGIGKTSRC